MPFSDKIFFFSRYLKFFNSFLCTDTQNAHPDMTIAMCACTCSDG